MKAFLSAVVALTLIGAVTWTILGRNLQRDSEEVFASSAVRLPQEH